MANIMEALRLRNTPTKSGFDLGRSIKFTAKVGEATPVGPAVVLFPNNTREFGIKSFTRTVNINTAAFARLRENYDFYFVPFEVLWKQFDSVIVQMKNNSQHSFGLLASDNQTLSLELPYFTCESFVKYLKRLIASDYDINSLGFKRSVCTIRLMSYLGYPDFSPYLQDDFTWEKYPMPNKMLSPFPLLAYQKVYADHIRYSQWENSAPNTFNIDFIKGTNDLELNIDSDEFVKDINFFDLRYFNYNKDLFMGLLPNTQYGDSAIVSLSGDSSVSSIISTGKSILFGANGSGAVKDPTPVNISNLATFDDPGYLNAVNAQVGTNNMTLNFGKAGSAVDSLSISSGSAGNSFSILALRQAEALQRWKEVSQSVDQDYKSQIEAHFGISVSDYLSHKSTWLKGFYGDLSINSVVNQNLTADNGADIKAYGTIGTNGNFTFESKDRYGIVLCLYHVSPIFDYTCGVVDPSTTLTHATDFPLPEFDRIGMESVGNHDLFLMPYSPTAQKVPGFPLLLNEVWKNYFTLGYAPRYIRWKTTLDIALGGFADKEKSWVLPFDYNALAEAFSTYQSSNPPQEIVRDYMISDNFRIDPHVVDTIFAVEAQDGYDSDHFRVNCFMSGSTTLPLDYNGLPY